MKKQLSYGFLVLLGLFGVLSYQQNLFLSFKYDYYILLIVFMIGAYFITMNQSKWIPMKKRDMLYAGISIASIVYCISIFVYFIISIGDEKIPFNMPLNHIGPFMHRQLVFLFLVQFLIFAFLLYRAREYSVDVRWILSVNLTGIFLGFIYFDMLKGMGTDVTAVLRTVKHITLNMTGIGSIGTAINIFLSVWAWRKNRK